MNHLEQELASQKIRYDTLNNHHKFIVGELAKLKEMINTICDGGVVTRIEE